MAYPVPLNPLPDLICCLMLVILCGVLACLRHFRQVSASAAAHTVPHGVDQPLSWQCISSVKAEKQWSVETWRLEFVPWLRPMMYFWWACVHDSECAVLILALLRIALMNMHNWVKVHVQTIDFERHAPAMDMFSLGVLLFVMLTGHKPMKSEQARKLAYSKLEATEYPKMQSWGWKQLSQPARKLVLQLMERDPAQRITAAQARLDVKLSCL